MSAQEEKAVADDWAQFAPRYVLGVQAKFVPPGPLTAEQSLGNEIARVRHGADVTASDLASRLMPWLADHDDAIRAAALEDAKPEGTIHDGYFW